MNKKLLIFNSKGSSYPKGGTLIFSRTVKIENKIPSRDPPLFCNNYRKPSFSEPWVIH